MNVSWITLLFVPSPPLVEVALCVAGLTLVSIVIALLVVSMRAQYIGHHKTSFFFFLVVLQVFTPIIGNILAFLAIFLLKNYQKKIYPLDIAIFKNPIYIRKSPVKIQAYAEGWAAVRLELSHFSEAERKQALISLNRGAKRNINLIYNQLVSDDMEELRICAFSLLENQQNFLHEKINELLKIYQKNPCEAAAKAFYAKQLALLYWEFIYLNLGEKEFRKIILEKSKYYAEIAIEFLKNDPDLLILLARIEIENGHISSGLASLQKAVHYHAPLNKIYPYLAENNYLKHDYEQVRRDLKVDGAFKYILKLNQVVEFWCKYD